MPEHVEFYNRIKLE